MKSNYLRSSFFFPITGVCLATLLLSFADVKLSVFIGLVLSFVLLMRAKPDIIVGMFLLYFMRYYFYYVGNFVTVDGAADYHLREVLTVFGFPAEVQTFACGYIAIRVTYEIFINPSTFRGKIPRFLLHLWIFGFLPIVAGAILARGMGHINWTGGLRFHMIIGSYFYGHILARHWPKEGNYVLISMLLPFVTIMLVLMNLSVFWSHHGFLFVGMGASFSIYMLRSRSIGNVLFGIFLISISMRYALNGSLTMILTGFLSLFFSLLATYRERLNSNLRGFIVKYFGTIAMIAIVAFTIGVTHIGNTGKFDHYRPDETYNPNFRERVVAKTLADRLPIWHAAWNQTFAGPYLIVPSGRPLYLNSYYFHGAWDNGSHNTILEAWRTNGLFSGSILIIILFIALQKNIAILKKSRDPAIKCLSAGVLGTGISCVMLNNIPIDMTIGFFLWSLAGLCHGLFFRNIHLERQARASSVAETALTNHPPVNRVRHIG